MEQNGTISPAATDSLTVRRRRLSFRAAHRGTFETDILIGGFVEAHVDKMDDAQLTDMEQVMQMPDPELTDWLFGRLPLPEDKATPMLSAMVRWCAGKGRESAV
ncbi:succinate dehydrogenase assembly factor 2 [Acetobacter sp. AN02]|uniref:succinate dehydrogenase assembly factor 2 n=1 Tax=Acetobacter sp. AN02 TaxID=2894186 RepID=UPI0024345ACB|nr:succinate dehydrogenase assembly factor 2 [Acetobacter sp. AN02]MDG6093952.1 succinate dehydrogenase assembly factor 2 [Acetobacter sp. AN02]